MHIQHQIDIRSLFPNIHVDHIIGILLFQVGPKYNIYGNMQINLVLFLSQILYGHEKNVGLALEDTTQYIIVHTKKLA